MPNTGCARKTVVVAGAGFGGLWAAKTLAGTGVDVVLVDRHNFHTFLPLLYQVAAAELEPSQVAYPVRGVFRRHRNVRVALGQVLGIDFENRALLTDGPPIPYDCLILALGSQTNFFGVEGAPEHCFGLKSLEEGIALRNHIMRMFELASLTDDPALQRELLTFAVAGGGPTGVEFAGALAELIRGPVAKDFPLLNLSQARVVLVEAGHKVLGPFHESQQRYALNTLGRKGVEVHLGAVVSKVGPDRVDFKDGSSLPTRTVVWAAGVSGPDAARDLGLEVGPGGRIPVGETLQVRSHPEIFAVGDMSWFEGPGGALPMLAPVAMDQGRAAARNALRLLEGKKLKPFRYSSKGIMATIGRSAAVASLGRLRMMGFGAWAVWLFVHLMMLIGFRNRLAVLINWAWDYLFFERSVRLIIPARARKARAGKNHEGMPPEEGKGDR